MTEGRHAESIPAARTGTPPCPACQDPHQIEPLQQQEDAWYVRCLSCGYGFRILHAPPRPGDRRRMEERRLVARSGRRAADLHHAVTCANCGAQDVHGWLRTGETLWARCRPCGHVQQAKDEPPPA